jgi:prefoldin subunit 5
MKGRLQIMSKVQNEEIISIESFFEDVDKEFDNLQETKREVMGSISKRHEELNASISKMQETLKATEELSSNNREELDRIFEELDRL